jgi:hypothetical protein
MPAPAAPGGSPVSGREQRRRGRAAPHRPAEGTVGGKSLSSNLHRARAVEPSHSACGRRSCRGLTPARRTSGIGRAPVRNPRRGRPRARNPPEARRCKRLARYRGARRKVDLKRGISVGKDARVLRLRVPLLAGAGVGAPDPPRSSCVVYPEADGEKPGVQPRLGPGYAGPHVDAEAQPGCLAARCPSAVPAWTRVGEAGRSTTVRGLGQPGHSRDGSSSERVLLSREVVFVDEPA